MQTMVGVNGVLMHSGRVMNEVVSFFVFSMLDILDMLLCLVYKMVDLVVEAEWRPCYCASAKEAITSSGNILVYERGESKVVCLTASKLQLEDISDTLYTRPSIASSVEIRRRIRGEGASIAAAHAHAQRSRSNSFTINSTIVEMLKEKMGGQHCHPIPRWSDCDCTTCNAWSSSSSTMDSLFVRTHGPQGTRCRALLTTLYSAHKCSVLLGPYLIFTLVIYVTVSL